MTLHDVEHPKLISVGGFTFRIISFSPLTDEQALKVAVHYLRHHKLKKAQMKDVLRIRTVLEGDSGHL